MLPMPKKLIRATRGNEFWDIVKKTLPKLGWRFHPELRGENLFVVLRAMDGQGIPKDVSYPVPIKAKDFRTAYNYKSQLGNFLRDYMAEHNLRPLSADLRPARTVLQHRPEPTTPRSAAESLFVRPPKPVIVFEKPKSVAPPPSDPIVEELPVMIAEVQADPLPMDEVLSESPQQTHFTLIPTIEHLESMMAKGKSDEIVLATFAAPVGQLQAMIDLSKGSMQFISAVSASGAPMATTASIQNGASKPKRRKKLAMSRRKHRPRFELQNKILRHAFTKELVDFGTSDLKSVARDTKALGNCLYTMMVRGLLKKSGKGRYNLSATGIKDAKAA